MRVFWLRSVRRRPVAFTVLAAVSLLAVAAAVLSPLLLRSVQEDSVRRAVDRAGTVRTAVFGVADAVAGQAETGLGAAVAIAEGADRLDLWRSSTPAVETDEAVRWSTSGTDPRSARLVAVGQRCGELTVSAGRCVSAAGEVLVPSTAGVRVGDRLRLLEGKPVDLVVVGLYTSLHAFAASPQAAAGISLTGTSPDLVVSLDQLDALQVEATAVAFRPLVHPFRLDDVDPARAGVAAAREAALTTSGAATNGRAVAGIGAVLDEVQPDLDAAAVLLGLLALDAVGLAWFATASVVQRLARARSAERGLARLRGLPAGRRAATALLEPGIAVLLGTVAGFPVGAALAALLAPAPIEPWRAPVLVVGALAAAGSIVALAASSLTGTRAPLVALLRATTEPRRAGRFAVATQVAVVLAAAIALYSLVTDDGAGGAGVAFTAPVLLALLVGLAASRAAALVLARPMHRAPRDAARLLAGRRIGRSPSVLTGAVAVLVGVAVAAFAVQLAAASATAQRDRAAAAVGAATVLSVAVPRSTSLLAAVDAADPSGREAMAAAELPEGREVGRLLAVDTRRFAAVTTWKPGWSPVALDRLAARLSPRSAAPIVLTGTSVRLRLADVRPGADATSPERVRIQLLVDGPSGWTTVVLGSARDGWLEAAAPCAAGCRLIALQAAAVDRNPTPFSIDITVTGVSTDREPAARFAPRLTAAQWRERLGPASDPSRPASASVGAGRGGLAVAFSDSAGGGTPGIAVRDVPEPIPVLLGPRTAAQPFAGVSGAVTGIGLDEETRLLHPIGRAVILPRTLGTGALADLAVLERSSDPAHDAAVEEVWLTPDASPRIVDRLQQKGVRVLDRQTVRGATADYGRDAPALAAAAAPLIGVVGLMLVLLARLGGGLLDAPARRRDSQAVRLAGVRPRDIRRAVALEVASPLVAAVLLGVAAGVVAFLLIAPHVDLTSGTALAPPLDTSLAVLPLLVLTAAALAVCALVSGAISAAETGEDAP